MSKKKTQKKKGKSKKPKAGVKISKVVLANGPATIVSHPDTKVPGELVNIKIIEK